MFQKAACCGTFLTAASASATAWAGLPSHDSLSGRKEPGHRVAHLGILRLMLEQRAEPLGGLALLAAPGQHQDEIELRRYPGASGLRVSGEATVQRRFPRPGK